MLPTFLISFREVLEAALIVATILSILTRLNLKHSIKTVWLATGAAILCSIFLLIAGSLLGIEVHELFEQHEAVFEGIVMIISAFFVTWAVFFLHKAFAKHKLSLLQQVTTVLEKNEQKGIFFLVFTAVFREGLEIVLFLSTLFFSNTTYSIGTGFILGACSAIVISFLLFTATIRLPIFKTFKLTSILLVLFAAGLLAHGIHELTEAGIIHSLAALPILTIPVLPVTSSFAGGVISSVFGLNRQMQSIELLAWCLYAWTMWSFVLKKADH